MIISAVSLFIKPAKRTIRASLVEAASGHIIDISQSETSIGRAKSCDIVIADISVSRFHAVLSKRSSGWMIFDTNSTAGIIVNDKYIEKKAYIEDGDTIILGKSEYIFYSTAVTTRQHIVPKTPADSAAKPANPRKSSIYTSRSAKNNVTKTRRHKSE
ncbi:MAG: FHA domain-containing protein [Clostridia bacterium]|nr:FHA domain-containing protein [Clostridia bacterium]